MITFLIITILVCIAIILSMTLQYILGEGYSFRFNRYTNTEWIFQILWWILQASLLLWGIIELYPNI